ncbi:ABC transporter permease [Paracoccus liaowanqingii]|uniref:ABC transporter permease n=1 Tax=Paracoccus liaowanqingii TaxID=2560053 RepID=A0A4Z1CS56_9RHOB|nr:ABC transporter permease [Paracoccus liaowanqingii]TGN68152.1 ABC transporter permease [Paracoccus liaowanqingii]
MSLSDATLAPAAAQGPTRAQGVGAAILLAVAAFAWGTPLLVPTDPLDQSLLDGLAGPDAAAPFGYDHLGRSLMARLAAALRLSLMIAAAAVISAGLLGVALGVLAAWRGGWTDRVLALLSDSVLALPGLLMVLIVSAIIPDTALAFWVGLTLVLWIEYFRLTRAATARLLAAPGVQASRLLGFGALYVFRRHLWPELAPMLLTVAAFGAATAIMLIAALGFVSVGIRPPRPELGQMMVELLPYYREAPLALVQPVIAIFLTILALNLLAQGRRA